MAAMNFPPTPTVGEEYVWEDFVYEWDGEKWTTQVTVVADNHVLKTGDTMTGDLVIDRSSESGKLIFQSRTDGIAMMRATSPEGLTMSGWGSEYDAALGQTQRTFISIYDKDTGAYIGDAFKYDHIGDTSDIRRPISSSNQGSAANALTRKDYVDGVVDDIRKVAVTDIRNEEPIKPPYSRDSGLWPIFGAGTDFGQAGAVYIKALEFQGWTDPSGGDAYQVMFGDNGLISYRNGKTEWGPVYRFYHEGFKPTAADVGAISKSGDNMDGTLGNSRVSGDFDDYSAFAGPSVGGGFAEMVTRRGVYHGYTNPDNVSYTPLTSMAYTNSTNGHSGRWSQGTIGEGAPNLNWAIHHIDASGNNAFAWYFKVSTGEFWSPGPVYQNGGQPVANQSEVDELKTTVAALLSRIEALEARLVM